MLPDKLSGPSLRRYWHVVLILLASTLAIASETSNFIFNNEALLLTRSTDENNVNHSSVRFSAVSNIEKVCQEKEVTTCKRVDPYIKYLIFFILAICALRYWIIDGKNQELVDLYREIFEFKNENPEKEIDNILQYIAEKKLKFRGSDRVSVYKYHPELDCFFRVGRFCSNPELSGGGKKQYKKDQGVISAAWNYEDGIYAVENLPELDGNDKRPWKEELDTRGIGGYNITQLRGMRMLSRSYYAITIAEPDSTVKCAVLVFESKTPKRFSKRTLQSVLKSDYGNVLKFFIYRRNILASGTWEPSDVS